MSRDLRIQTRLILSKSFPPGRADFACGRYHISALPSADSDNAEALLEFSSTYEAPVGGGSNPEEEANIICDILSLILEMRIKRSGLRVEDIDIPTGRGDRRYPRYKGHLSPDDTTEYLQRIMFLPLDLARQVSRACRAYSSALDYIPSDPTFAFFLFAVSIECLSSQQAIIPPEELHPDSKKCERFCTFISRFLPDYARGDDERNPVLLKELLKTVYYSHRSGFVHGGKEVSCAATMADRAGSSYLKHVVDGNEVKTPGLGWFAAVVRHAILGYLSEQPIGESPSEDMIGQLANEKATLMLKATRDMDKGQVVTFDDVEFR